MPSDRDKVAGLRERTRLRLLREQRSLSKAKKSKLGEIQKHLERKTRSSLPVRQRATAAATA
jgi:hypothetical protein